MSFFAILFALLVEQVRPLGFANPVYEGVRQWARWGSRSLDTGRVPHGWLAWAVVVCGPALLATSWQQRSAGEVLTNRGQMAPRALSAASPHRP